MDGSGVGVSLFLWITSCVTRLTMYIICINIPRMMNEESLSTTNVQKLDFYPNKCPSVDDDPSVHCLVRQSSARATDGRMEDDEDDDPFDGDHVEVSQPAHRRSVGANYDMKGTKAKFTQGLNACMQFALDPQFTCEPAEGAHLLDSVSKLEHFLNNLQTHREMSPCISRNSEMEDGAVGMANLQNVSVRGAKGDTTSRRKRDFVEKFVDERKRKESKGTRQTRLQ